MPFCAFLASALWLVTFHIKLWMIFELLVKYIFICYHIDVQAITPFLDFQIKYILARWGKIKEKIKVKACPKGQLITALERLLNEIKKGYLAIGDARLDLPKTVDLKMELEEKNGRVEFELELNWPLHPVEEAGTGEAAKAKEKEGKAAEREEEEDGKEDKEEGEEEEKEEEEIEEEEEEEEEATEASGETPKT